MPDVLPGQRHDHSQLTSAEQRSQAEEHPGTEQSAQEDEEEVEERPWPGHGAGD
jgi:hypothetical protein